MIHFDYQVGRNDHQTTEDDSPTPDYVNFSDYLPNYLKHSPLKRDHSMTSQTAKYYPKLLKRNYTSTVNTSTLLNGDNSSLNVSMFEANDIN